MSAAPARAVIDASVVVDWIAPRVDPELPSVLLLDRLASSSTELLAPRLLLEEVSNALLTGIRRGRWSGPEADAAAVLLRELPVRLLDGAQDLARAWELARRFDNHPVYDMVYVALAQRRESELITADQTLRRRLIGIDGIVGPEQVLAR